MTNAIQLSIVTFALGLAACSGSSESATGSSAPQGSGGSSASHSASTATVTTAVTTATTDAATSGSGGSTTCTAPGLHSPGNTLDVGDVHALVHDLSGAPIANGTAQVCGFNLCLTAMTGADGSVDVSGGGKSLDNPAFKFGDGYQYGKFAIPLKMAGAVDLGAIQTTAMPMTGVALTAGTKPSSGGVTLEIAAGAVVTIDELNQDTPDKQMFRAAPIPVAQVPAPMTTSIDLVFATGPLETTFCPAASVEVPNSLGWAAGAAVEFWVHGLDISESWAPYGGWAKVSDGAVSADGTTIRTAAGQGLPVLSTFGIRKL
jgi:hypothetical protein